MQQIGKTSAQSKAQRHRIIRQLHLWIGAWGAIAAIVFGFTGFLQNHRAMLKLPQGESTEIAKFELPIAETARATPDAMRAWLHDDQHMDIDNVRVMPAVPVEFNGQKIRPPARWMFTGGNARTSTQVDYTEGNAAASVKTTQQSPLATLTRLHKSIGGGVAWILLADTFAWSMIALGISGLLLWARGRSVKQLIFSGVGAAVLVLLLVGGHAVV